MYVHKITLKFRLDESQAEKIKILFSSVYETELIVVRDKRKLTGSKHLYQFIIYVKVHIQSIDFISRYSSGIGKLIEQRLAPNSYISHKIN